MKIKKIEVQIFRNQDETTCQVIWWVLDQENCDYCFYKANGLRAVRLW